MGGMKTTVSLVIDDVSYLDERVAQGVYPSRSAAVAAAVRGMRERELTQSYVDAFDEWAASDDAALWDATSADGLLGAGRHEDGAR